MSWLPSLRSAPGLVSRCGARALPSVLAACLVLWVMGLAAARAQPCTADSQCRDFGQTRTYCSGNTLVVKQSRCIGRCQSVEVSRIPCPGPCVADRCVGGSLGSSPAGPPRGGGFVAGVCATICTCKDKKLTYGVGYAAKAEQCGRRTVDCVYGCTCDPEPRCLKRGES
ncbi:MAG: hypothetical protein R3D44_12335 [Hyphomicrobiaceae bacterium]